MQERLLRACLATHIVELDNLRAIIFQCLRSANILDTIVSPQTIRIAERGDTAIGTHTSTRKNNYSLLHSSRFYSPKLQNFRQKFILSKFFIG